MEALIFAIVFPVGDPYFDETRFPNKEQTESALAFNSKYREWLLSGRGIHGSENPFWVAWFLVWNPEEWKWYQAALEETRKLREPWQTLQYLHMVEEPEYKRIHLNELRRLLGEREYWSGRMPPPVPLARMREI